MPFQLTHQWKTKNLVAVIPVVVLLKHQLKGMLQKLVATIPVSVVTVENSKNVVEKIYKLPENLFVNNKQCSNEPIITSRLLRQDGMC